MIWPVKPALTVALVLALAGCGVPDDGNNHGYGYHYDVLGESGLRLRYTPALQPSSPVYEYLSSVEFHEATFQRMQDCMGLTAPAPFTIIVEPGSLGSLNGIPLAGYYFTNPSLIVLAANEVGALRHEDTHYLLHHGTGDLDPEHLTAAFKAPDGCAWSVPWR